MKIIIAIDIKNGKVVELSCHDEKILSDRPVEFCLSLKEKGVEKLHIVDLDGVFSGKTRMLDLLKEIKEKVDLPIQFAGGISTLEIASEIVALGVDEIVIASSAIKDQDFLIELLEKYPKQVIVAVDVYKNLVYTEGLEANRSTSISEFLNILQLIHVPHVLMTDISNEATLSAVNRELIEALLNFEALKISLSARIQSTQELSDLKKYNLYSLVITRAVIEDLISIS